MRGICEQNRNVIPTSDEMVFMGFVHDDDDFDDAWALAEPLLTRSLEYTPFLTIEDLKDDFYNRRRLLWLVKHIEDGVIAACMSSVINHTLMIEHCGGRDVERWLPEVWRVFQRYAELGELRGMAIVGRKGWLRHLRQHGDITYKEVAVFTSKPEYMTRVH